MGARSVDVRESRSKVAAVNAVATSVDAETPVRPFSRSKLISGARLRELSRHAPAATLAVIAFDLAVIVALAAAAEWLRRVAPAYVSVPAYIVAVAGIGTRQFGIAGIALHDGCHTLILRDRAWNDRVANALLGMLLARPLTATTLNGYRDFHLHHHRTANTDKDPSFGIAAIPYRWPRWKLAGLFLLDLTGISWLIFGVIFRLYARQSVVSFLAFVVAAVLGAHYFPHASLLVLRYWLVPIVTWGWFGNTLRGLAEHYPVDAMAPNAEVPALFLTRDIRTTWFDRHFVVSRYLNLHLTHHIFPSVPSIRLAELQRELSAMPEYRKYAHVVDGYHRVVWEFFSRRRSDVEIDSVKAMIPSEG